MYHVFSRMKKPDCKNWLDIQLWFIPKGNPCNSKGEKVAHWSHRCNSHLPFLERSHRRKKKITNQNCNIAKSPLKPQEKCNYNLATKQQLLQAELNHILTKNHHSSFPSTLRLKRGPLYFYCWKTKSPLESGNTYLFLNFHQKLLPNLPWKWIPDTEGKDIECNRKNVFSKIVPKDLNS